ncbi:MAG TPA: hypothetical protein VG053_09355 [Solirubrobacteraceae bacterium]|jgi:hypothetical protein|nr:hypothetical protein [Solirubrobacteraceae bacterium]
MGERTTTLARRLRFFAGDRPVSAFEHVPTPPSERSHWLLAGTIAALGVAVLVAVLTGLVGRSPSVPAAPPAVLVAAATPAPPAGPAGVSATSAPAAIVAQPPAETQSLTRLESPLQTRVSTRWMEGFYPIYSVAQTTFGVNWLLIASIHEQESAFSTAPSTYHGLNFAGCCGGPMQFNVTNGGGRGTGSTWDLVSNSYRYGVRPAAYDHPTARHPSIYDDFDAIMAAAHLLSADGATLALERGAWSAAYDYYGHDAAGVAYADQVLARAIGWSQHGFCANCGVEPAMVAAVHAAYGAPVLAALTPAHTAPRAAAARVAPSARAHGH